MAGVAVVINDAFRGGLEALTRAGNTAQKLVRRARIALLASQGWSDSEMSRELDINRKTAALWRQRMAEPETRKQVAEPAAPIAAEPLERTQPGLPWKKGKCGTYTHDYKRHGTTTLFAAYNVATGQVIGECHPHHSNREFLRLLRRLDKETAAGLTVHIILDNAGYHRHKNVKRWLKSHKRFQFHFIPTSSSWTNLVERWFGLLTEESIRRGVFHGVEELKQTIYRYIEIHNVAPQPFRWRASVRTILEKIQRAAWAVGFPLPWSLPPELAT